jgi:hypothetical protein
LPTLLPALPGLQYYHPRWSLFFDALQASLSPGAPAFDQQAFTQGALVPFEVAFQRQTAPGFPAEAAGQPMGLAAEVARKYFS